ncbi:ATP-binding protein [Actinacidiphila acididurans]|uniref:ATP-binding protein n=1 Tax=Actinacidiphila acididurans TaxID=2784346 RepID=UPI0027DC4104|nr:ATP-binding protein [Actinacidiphila acididurans]
MAPLPVVVLTAPLGGGGSTVLDNLWGEFFEKSLSVRLDVGDAQGVEDIVLAAVQGWKRRVPGIRRMPFPRVGVIIKALSFVGDPQDRAGFEKYLNAGPREAAVQTALRDWADRAAPMLPPDQQVMARAIASLLSALQAALGRHGTRRTLRWLADPEVPGGGNGYDLLWRLWRRHVVDHDNAAVREVGKVLCAALLADARWAFNDAFQPGGQRLMNALLLVDNADNPMGDLFLDLLAECRRESRSSQRPDPLVVVAVRHGPVHAMRMGRAVASNDLELVFAPQVNEPPWFVPVRLAGLESTHVLEMCRSSVLGNTHRDGDFLRDLTGGHPEAVDRLAHLLAAFGRQAHDPRLLLAEPLPPRFELPEHWPPDHGTATTVEDYLLKRLLPEDLAVLTDGRLDPGGNPELDAMAVLAATPGLRLDACTAAFRSLEWHSSANANDARSRLTSALWLEEPHAGEAWEPHPMIALLLRRWLARRPQVWGRAHEGYVAHYTHVGNTPLRYRHTLAQAEPSQRAHLTGVVNYLERELDRPTATADWLPVLDQITTAPNRLRTAGDPRGFVTTLAGVAQADDRRRAITRLTVARWLFRDRTFDPAHRLAKTIADEYEALATFLTDSQALFEEADKYRVIENTWK